MQKIINIGVVQGGDIAENELVKYTNKYFVVIFFVLFVFSLFSYIHDSDLIEGSVLMFLSLFSMGMIFFVKLRKNLLFLLGCFILYGVVIFYYANLTGKQAGVYFFYFPCMLATPIIFNYKTERKYIIFVLSYIFILFIANLYIYYFFPKKEVYNLNGQKIVFFISFIFSVLLVFINAIFLIQKNTVITKFADVKKVDESYVLKLRDLAENNDPAFFSAYIDLYPNFCNKLLEKNSMLTYQEMELCAFVKLGYTTKEIAHYAKLSERAVEGRKYRLRKKINCSNEYELITWLDTLDADYVR